MCKLLCVLLLFSLLLSIVPACAAEDVPRRTVEYPGYDFNFAIPAHYHAFYRDNIGLTIDLPDQKSTAYTRVQVMPYDPNFDEVDYFENTWIPREKEFYTSKYYNWLLDVGEIKTYKLGGREMIGMVTLNNLANHVSQDLVAFDRWNGMVIRYEAYFPQEDPDGTLLMLSNLIRSVTTPTFAPTATKQNVSAIDYPEQRFSTAAKASYPRKYDDSNGLTIYTEAEGRIPYVMVYQSNNLIVETYELIREQYTPHIKDQYGDDLLSTSEYPHFIIGGRDAPAGVYTYRVQGKEVVMIRIYDSTGPRTAIFTAKYIKGEGADTLLALDAAIRNFHSTAEKIW